ncbi:hypothetical protein CC80DRAFT_409106 [Byssothecium circinans]|uniref:Transcription regulator Rua1 C-terminal domain-containing protein n=1 Tax=Byssothecium circinans TaxID=147558 RepID=A0A6A5U3A6_9PLEO|nr:hypothetical protein CC80DRAFT_409106 [Byssothecium circinans]
MEFNAVQQYRPSSNRSFTTNHSSGEAPQMMYAYGSMPLSQSQTMQHVSRSSPPQPTWAAPQPHNPYYQMQRGPVAVSRDDTQHLIAKTHITSSHSPAMSTATFRDGMSAHEGMGTGPDYFPGIIDTSPWGQKVCEELEQFPSLDAEMNEFNQGLMGHDENTPIIDLRQYHGMDHRENENAANFNPHSTRRLSESSFSISSTGGVLPEVSNYEEIGSSEAVSYASDCEVWNTLEPAPTLLSPLASPRRLQHDNVVRSGSRSRASPAPHNNVRSSPYTLESSRFKRWSTGTPTSTPASTRPLSQVQDRFAPYGPRLNPHHSMPAYPSSMSNFGIPNQNVLYSQTHPLQSSNPTLFSSQDHPFRLEVPRPIPSQGLFRLLQSNADRHGGCASHFADLSDPPDLYSSLHEEPCDPPESDMNPSDPDLVPHEQDLRFAGDMYTPRWVRGHGNKREGWCGLCKPGRWLVLKNSAFWYDKSFTHGVSAATGAAFQGPQDTRRTEGNLDVWEGLCGSCGDWIALVSSKKKGTTWFRHAYKCHTHPKVKDGPKRRRETHAVRARAVSSASNTSSSYPIKSESQTETKSHRHSTPIPTSSLQALGIPISAPPLPPTSTPQPSHVTPYPTPSAYPTPTSSTALYPPANMLSAESNNCRSEGPVVGMFRSPLQQGSTFHPAHAISEPELVGVPRTTALGSLASMI